MRKEIIRTPIIFRVIILLGLLSGCVPILSNQTDTTINRDKHFALTSKLYARMFDGSNPNVALLNLFFSKMPKGGDLHHHYTGTVYAETYLDWVKQKDWRIDKHSFKIVTRQDSHDDTEELLTVRQLLADEALYRKLLTLWSNKDYRNHSHPQPPPDMNFFKTFSYFNPISHEYMERGLQILKQRAIQENVVYIETMLSRVGVKGKDYFAKDHAMRLITLLRNAKSQQETNIVLEQITAILLGNTRFMSAVNAFVRLVEKNHRGIDDQNFMMRYQSYAVRVCDPLQVFTDLLAAYLAVKQSPLIVGVNIVAPENHPVALTDYTSHMRMYHYLLEKYPAVNRALHAGELTLGMVRPKHLTFHIQQAHDIAQAQRIGHGVDLPYEQNAVELLKDLKENAVIEINLTSNEFILGVKNNEHPYLIYSSYGVPLVIATDDSGVSRNNLTNEYVLLATRYQPTYGRVKEYVYNSIRYSFLPQADKEFLTRLLDSKFMLFEREMTDLYKSLRP